MVLKFSPNTPTANYFVMEPLLKPALLRNILAFRGLSTSSSKSSQSSVAESRVIKNKWRGGQKRFASTKDAPASPELANSAHLPLFLRSFEYPQRTAVCGLEEDVHHGEALRRFVHAVSTYKGHVIRDTFWRLVKFLGKIRDPGKGQTSPW